jgi:threonine dehydratase
MPTQDQIRATHRLIAPYIRKTPIIRLDATDFGLGPFEIVLKLELMQHAGSFKTRGAFTHMLTREIPAAGVVAASGGNHGAAVAYAAHKLRKPARIFVPTISSPAKVNRIRSYGAELHVAGDRYADALALSREYAKQSGALEVHAFDQEETLRGQGTLGLELFDQAPGVQTVMTAVGGGGLVGGVASWFRSSVRVIGVEPVEAPTLTRALEAGRPVDAPQGGYAADSLAPARIGELVFPICREHVDRALLVTDDEIRASQAALWDKCRIVAEPGGAAAFAALLSRAYKPAEGERVAVVVSGGNTTAVDFSPK